MKSRADLRLESALDSAGLQDPREYFRDRLRWLKDRDRSAFDRAREHYDSVLIPNVAREDSDPLQGWLDYGQRLAELSGRGRVVTIDATGRATSGIQSAGLVLHIPDDDSTPTFVISAPASPTPAQQASFDLLVLKKLRI